MKRQSIIHRNAIMTIAVVKSILLLSLMSNSGAEFSNIAGESGIDNDAVSSGVSWGDYNNDGHEDVFVANLLGGIADRLYRNNGDGTFTDVAAVAGVDDTGFSLAGSWGDYNNDGWVDLYVTASIIPEGEAESVGVPDLLFRNEQNDGNFLKVRPTDAQGILNRQGAIVRVFEAGTENLAGTRPIGGDSGKYAQGSYGAHFGLSAEGRYDVRVSFPGGTVVDKETNPLLGNVSPLNIPLGYIEVRQNGIVRLAPDPRLEITRTMQSVVISWTGEGQLESALTVTGPWKTVENAVSPYASALTGDAQYYRLVNRNSN